MATQSLKASLKYQQWASRLASNKIDLKSVEELKTIQKRNGGKSFQYDCIDATSPENTPLLPIAVLRGDFVSILTCLIDRETKERFLLLVKQRRVANGALFYEMPAGMTDSNTDPFDVAIHEMVEETSVVITRDQLTLLNDELLYSSPGLIDEAGWFFSVELEMSGAEIKALHDRATGAEGENEFIRTHIATFAEAKKLIKNTNGLVNIFLYESQQG